MFLPGKYKKNLSTACARTHSERVIVVNWVYTTPMSGVVDQRMATLGQAVEPNTTLFRIDPQSMVATRVPVRLGRASVNLIEVVQGLKPGDQVILSDTSQWDRNDRLKLE